MSIQKLIEVFENDSAGMLAVCDAVREALPELKAAVASKKEEPKIPKGWKLWPPAPTLDMQHAYMNSIEKNRSKMESTKTTFGWHDAHYLAYIEMGKVVPDPKDV